MKTLLAVVLGLALTGCEGADRDDATGTTATETAAETETTGGYVENVTRAQGKAREIAAEEKKRAAETDEVMEEP